MASTLLNGEQIITETGDQIIMLTNYRIRKNISGGGHAHIVSILLDKVSNIEIRYKSNLLALILGILCFPFGIGLAAGVEEPQVIIPFCFIGIVFVVFYFITRKHVVSIYANSGRSIDFKTKGLKRESILRFVNQVEEARMNYDPNLAKSLIKSETVGEN